MGIGKFSARRAARPRSAEGELIVLDPLRDVFPLLKPSDWPHAELVPHARIGTPEEQIIIAFARDVGDNYELITTTAPEAADSDELHARALANLGALHYEWERADTQGLIMATCSGHEFAAEKLLDPDAMRQAHQLLRSEEIIVAAPRRTCLYAFPRSVLDNPETTQLMMKVVYYTFMDDSFGNAPITSLMFVLRDGAPVGFVKPGA